jgi:WXG100 family type VII secretion target
MPDREMLRLQPEAMQTASQALARAAKDIHAKLAELDGQVRDMLAGWHGGAGGAYNDVWEQWHKGAGEVQLGLDILAKAIGSAGAEFKAREGVSAQQLEGVYRG